MKTKKVKKAITALKDSLGHPQAWFPLHGKRHDHDTKTKRL